MGGGGRYCRCLVWCLWVKDQPGVVGCWWLRSWWGVGIVFLKLEGPYEGMGVGWRWVGVFDLELLDYRSGVGLFVLVEWGGFGVLGCGGSELT